MGTRQKSDCQTCVNIDVDDGVRQQSKTSRRQGDGDGGVPRRCWDPGRPSNKGEGWNNALAQTAVVLKGIAVLATTSPPRPPAVKTLLVHSHTTWSFGFHSKLPQATIPPLPPTLPLPTAQYPGYFSKRIEIVMARDNGRRGAYLHASDANAEVSAGSCCFPPLSNRYLLLPPSFSLADDARRQMPAAQRPQNKNTKPKQYRHSSPTLTNDEIGAENMAKPPRFHRPTAFFGRYSLSDFGSSIGSSIHSDNDDNVHYAADDSLGATPSQALVSLTPDGTPTQHTDADLAARLARHFHISPADKFFDDQIPDDINARFPVIEHHHNDPLVAATTSALAPALSAADAKTQPPKRLNLVGRYSLSPTRFLGNLSSPFRRSAARSDEAVEDVAHAWRDFIIAYVTILVVIGCFLVIMLDGVRWVMGVFWGVFCVVMDKLLMLD